MPQGAPTVFETVLSAFHAHSLAVQRHEEQDTCATADEVIASRLAVLRALVAEGWTPPARVVDQVATDAVLVRLPLGVMGDAARP